MGVLMSFKWTAITISPIFFPLAKRSVLKKDVDCTLMGLSADLDMTDSVKIKLNHEEATETDINSSKKACQLTV